VLKAAPNIQIWINHVLSGVEAIQVPNGGSRAACSTRAITLRGLLDGLLRTGAGSGPDKVSMLARGSGIVRICTPAGPRTAAWAWPWTCMT